MAEELLFGKLVKGGSVLVSVNRWRADYRIRFERENGTGRLIGALWRAGLTQHALQCPHQANTANGQRHRDLNSSAIPALVRCPGTQQNHHWQ